MNIKRDFESFRDSQHNVLTTLLTTGSFGGVPHDQGLALNLAGPTVLEKYGADVVRGRATEFEHEGSDLKRRCRAEREKNGKETDEEAEQQCQAEATAVRTHWSLIRVCAVISAFEYVYIIPRTCPCKLISLPSLVQTLYQQFN